MVEKIKKSALPPFFKSLFWGYDFNSIDLIKDKKLIIINTLNYGNLEHWRWLVKRYGKRNLRNIIELTPKSEFRKEVVPLIKLLLGVKKFKYASRSDYIRSQKGI